MHKAVYPVLGNETVLPFYLTGTGRNSPEHHVRRDKGLVSHQLLFTEKGCGILSVSGIEYILGKDSLLYLPPGLPHEYYPEKDEWATSWLVFRGEGIDDTMKSMGFEGMLLSDKTELSAMKKLFGRIWGLAPDNLHNSAKCSLLIYETVLLARDIFSGSSEDLSSGSIIVDKAVRYINDHISSDISLSELAEYSGISAQHLCRLFKSRLGMTPIEYVTRIKLSRAKSMLLDSDMPVSEIADALGYASHTYFGIVFRKYEGISPSEFRKNSGSII